MRYPKLAEVGTATHGGAAANRGLLRTEGTDGTYPHASFATAPGDEPEMPPTELNPCMTAKWRNTARRHSESFRPSPCSHGPATTIHGTHQFSEAKAKEHAMAVARSYIHDQKHEELPVLPEMTWVPTGPEDWLVWG